jgi:Polyketide cyclase / dehydrase and lipid transport
MAEVQQKKSGSVIGKLFKWTLVLLLLVVAAVVVIGQFVLDGKYDLSREIAIKAPPAEIHKQVGDLREWPNWLPFTKHDPSVVTTIEKPTGVGANQHWTGKGGSGELTFTVSEEDKGIEFNMLFDKKYASKGSLIYAKSGDDTRVTWRMSGQNDDFVGKWMAALMPYMVGPYFEEGLGDLKKKVEAK